MPCRNCLGKKNIDRYPSAYANMAASKYCKDPNYAKKSKNNVSAYKEKKKKTFKRLDRNKSGRDETVLMSSYTNKNETRFFAAPTITFKGNEKKRPQGFKEALEAGEVYEFKSKRKSTLGKREKIKEK